MKDDLPDLTPYLSKKGGNNPARGGAPAPKADISQKLSALVKKPGTGTVSGIPGVDSEPQNESDEVIDTVSNDSNGQMQNMSAPAAQSEPDQAPPSQVGSASTSWSDAVSLGTPATNRSYPSGDDELEPFDDAAPSAPAPATSAPSTSSSFAAPSDNAAQSDFSQPAASEPAPDAHQDANISQVRHVTSERPKPVTPTLPSDKFRAPQAKPLNTLSSGGNPPLLKTPSKAPGRSPQPYSFRPDDYPGEGVAPKAVPISSPPKPNLPQSGLRPNQPASPGSLPNPNSLTNPSGANGQTPRPVSPTLPQPGASRPADNALVSRPAQAQPAAPVQRQAPSAAPAAQTPAPAPAPAPAPMPAAPPVNAAPAPAPAPSQSPSDFQAPAASAPASTPPANPRSSAQGLAKSGPKQNLASSLFDDEDDFSSPAPAAASGGAPDKDALARAFMEESQALAQDTQKPAEALSADYYSDQPSTKPLGFGNLLGGLGTDEGSQRHALTDLMTPTGQQSTQFAAERQSDEASFDEPQQTDSGDSFREVGAAAPAFSSLFSTEIVTGLDTAAAAAPVIDNSDFNAPVPVQNFNDDEGFGKFVPPTDTTGDIKVDNSAFESESSVLSAQLEPWQMAMPAAAAETDAEPSAPAPYSSSSILDDPGLSELSETAVKQDGYGLKALIDEPQATVEPESQVDSFAEPESLKSAPKKDEARQSKSIVISKLMEAVNKSKEEQDESLSPQSALTADTSAVAEPVAEVAADSVQSSDTAVSGKAAEAAEVARILAELDTPRVDDHEVSLDELKVLLKKEKQAKKEAARKAKEEEEARLAGAVAGADTTEAPAEPKNPFAPSLDSEVDKKSAIDPADYDIPIAQKLAEAARKKAESDAPKKGGLASLLSGSDDEAPAPKEEPVAEKKSLSSLFGSESAPQEEEDDDERESSLGDAVGAALDKLLADVEGGDKPAEKPAPMESTTNVVGGLNKLNFAKPEAEEMLEQKIAASAAEPDESKVDPMTMTQSKVDALSRLLEVASKAPEKGPEEGKKPQDSASKLAEMINKPPTKVSRQSMESVDARSQDAGGAYGGASPFTSPFAAPSSSMTNYPSQSADMGGVQSAPVSGDAVSARIAALNRKLEEQSRPPSYSQASIPAQSPPPPPPPPAASDSYSGSGFASNQATTGSGYNPGASSASIPQTPPPLSDYEEVGSKSELVNRILGQAKLGQSNTDPHGRAPGAEPVSIEQVQQMRNVKTKQQKVSNPRETVTNRSRSRSGPGVNPAMIVGGIVAALVVIGGGGYFAVTSGIIDVSKVKSAINPDKISSMMADKQTVDQHIKAGEFARAKEMLEAKQKSGKLTGAELEKLYGVYYSLGEEMSNDGSDNADAVKLLEKIPSKSKKHKDAQKLLRKLKKKVKKN